MSNTFTNLRQRVNFLIGDTSAATQAIVDSHINAAVRDIVNAYPFSWNLVGTTAPLIAGAFANEYSFALPADFNPKWYLHDARIVNSNVADDFVFTNIVINDRDAYGPQTYKWWLTYSVFAGSYFFNTKEPSGTVTYYYYFYPTALAAGSDLCFIPDTEAVCYLAASKNWVTDERNQTLSALYKQEASSRIQSMWQTDGSFGPVPVEGDPVDYNQFLIRR